MGKRWINSARIKVGAFHAQLGYPPGNILPHGLVEEITRANLGTHVRGYKVTPLLKRRALFALNAQKRRRV